jgi:DNA polymerase-3 subunit alpha
MYLKRFYRAKFFAALLSMQNSEDKINLYVKTAKDYGINIKAPDVNNSQNDFIELNDEILYGLKTIKGVGSASIPNIIANRPYKNIQDCIDKLDSKSFNKRIGMGLIKAGAFDFYNSNRYELINEFYDIRKDKKEERLDVTSYNESVCMELEKEVLGACVTYTPWWDTVLPGSQFSQELEIVSVQTKRDRKGNMMAFPVLAHNGVTIKAVAFASVYGKNVMAFDKELNDTINIFGEKDDKGQIIIKKVLPLTK